MKKLLLLLSITGTSLICLSQKINSSNSLLWRISGNGLTKPSYLYGTMHLTDKRVFYFSDSLYKALEQSDAFAAELDINRMGAQLINSFINEREQRAASEPVKVKDAVSVEVWEKYKDLLAEKFFKPAEKITVNDLDDVESALQSELFKKGEMPTFLDAYLFGLARKQGKWVGGIEDFQEQVEHINAESVESKIQMALYDDKNYRKAIEWMIKMYTGQRLDSIEVLYTASNGQKDFIMTKRNLKMATRMDSMSAIRSTFFAVGAAHLPGDSGVIALLKNRGFTVSPVVSSKKISPEKYTVKRVGWEWVPVGIKDSIYSLLMPGESGDFEILRSMGIDSKIFFDMSFMRMYMTMRIEIGKERKKLGIDSLYAAFKQQFSKKGKLVKEKKVRMNDLEGREYLIQAEDGDFHLQIFLPELENVIMNAVFSMGNKSSGDTEAERFFQSFAYNKNYKKPEPRQAQWSSIAFVNHGFSIEMPVQPRETKDVNSEEGKIIYNYQAIDLKSQMFYGMRISSVKEGLYDPGIDSNFFIGVKDRLRANFGEGRILDSSYLTISGYPGYSVTADGKSEGTLLETSIITVSRGNRNFYVYAVFEPGEENRISARRFLNSFKILPYAYNDWETVLSPDSSFSTISPGVIKKVEIEENGFHEGSERFIIYDSIGSTSTYIDKTQIPGWVWFSSDTAFLRNRAEQYKGVGDSIEGYNVNKSDKGAVAEFFVRTPQSQLVKKVKFVLSGAELYELFSHIAPQDLNGLYERLFNGFISREPKSNERGGQSRAEELLNTLEAADGKVIRQIKLWWNDLDFTKADLPALQKMSFRLYPDFDTLYNSDALNGKIMDKIGELDDDHNMIRYIRDHYQSIQANDEYVKPFLVSYLSGIKSKESYSVLKEILINYPLRIQHPIYFSNNFYDSLSLTATLYPELFIYAGKDVLCHQVTSMAASLLDSNLISNTSIKQNAAGFITSAQRIIIKEKNDIEEYGYNYYDWIRMLGVINTPESNALLNKFSKFNDRGVRFKTLIALLKNNKPVDSKTIYTLATTDEYRHDLFEELKKIKKQGLFPLQYLSQRDLAKSKIYVYAADEDQPGIISYAGEKIIDFKGKNQKFYLFKVPISTDFDAETYLGIAGPYSVNPKEYLSTHELTGIYWQEEFDAKKTDFFFKEYISSLEEEPTGQEQAPTNVQTSN
ncbi:TraB/GumN family protein [Terrimonas alba]|uniref:TraB/GumN family protein n=1 Tax=Terrimonas alba TaxID=3349636 RepID=UPI0035F27B2B